jgi:hypothetical protein
MIDSESMPKDLEKHESFVRRCYNRPRPERFRKLNTILEEALSESQVAPKSDVGTKNFREPVGFRIVQSPSGKRPNTVVALLDDFIG